MIIYSAQAKIIALHEGVNISAGQGDGILLSTGAKMYRCKNSNRWRILGYAANGSDVQFYKDFFELDTIESSFDC